MGKLINAYIIPHPPIIVPGIGRGREKQASGTVEAVKRAAREIGKDKPTTIILSTPHAPCFRDYVYIADSEILEGDFAAFGHPDIKFWCQNNKELASLIAEKAELAGISAGGLGESQKRQLGISDRLDHGSLVPLCFIEKEVEKFRLVCVSTPFLPFRVLYEFGKCIRAAVEASDERVVYVASADLSHRLTRDAPSGYHSKGPEYDAYLIDKVRTADVEGLLKTDEGFLEKAGECGTRSIIMMFGALHGRRLDPEVYSYEGPYGVGYMIAKISSGDIEAGKAGSGSAEKNSKAGSGNAENSKAGNADASSGIDSESDFVRLARETLETYVREGNKINVPQWVTQEFKTKRAGVFVSLKKKGELRGCIGTIGPVRVNIAEEIINNAISAGAQDPRFPAVKEKELKDLVYSVDVLGAPEKIESMKELNVKRYGVIVTSGFRRGLLLPDLEGVDTPEQQVGIALQKAGIRPSERYEMERFEVIRYR
ncbi:MAG TPA: AmmeMemoRadiSam system protein A [Anaerovoracaceae bacterium]|nr:AmmeMemoRadiSam system protein A [Anaerovoracaceae bacterium]